MPVTIPAVAPATLASATLVPSGPVHPSPSGWRAQNLYFLLPDRFSDGAEAGRPPSSGSFAAHAPASTSAWMAAGTVFQGGDDCWHSG